MHGPNNIFRVMEANRSIFNPLRGVDVVDVSAYAWEQGYIRRNDTSEKSVYHEEKEMNYRLTNSQEKALSAIVDSIFLHELTLDMVSYAVRNRIREDEKAAAEAAKEWQRKMDVMKDWRANDGHREDTL